jgi:hypothetical protein
MGAKHRAGGCSSGRSSAMQESGFVATSPSFEHSVHGGRSVLPGVKRVSMCLYMGKRGGR